jgi:hypothetical protein
MVDPGPCFCVGFMGLKGKETPVLIVFQTLGVSTGCAFYVCHVSTLAGLSLCKMICFRSAASACFHTVILQEYLNVKVIFVVAR